MLIELQDVEVHIEPRDILIQALRDGDITVDSVIYECTSEESVTAVLDALDKDDIEEYVEEHGIASSYADLSSIIRGLRILNEDDKAKVLWILLKG